MIFKTSNKKLNTEKQPMISMMEIPASKAYFLQYIEQFYGKTLKYIFYSKA